MFMPSFDLPIFYGVVFVGNDFQAKKRQAAGVFSAPCCLLDMSLDTKIKLPKAYSSLTSTDLPSVQMRSKS